MDDETYLEDAPRWSGDQRAEFSLGTLVCVVVGLLHCPSLRAASRSSARRRLRPRADSSRRKSDALVPSVPVSTQATAPATATGGRPLQGSDERLGTAKLTETAWVSDPWG